MLHKYHPLWMNIHVNHPNEITPELRRACAMLADAGVPLGNQSVLLAGVNDCVHIQRKLVHELVKMRVRPYYLYQCDLVEGAGHFRTPVAKASKSSRACAATPAAMPCHITLLMRPAAAVRCRSCRTICYPCRMSAWCCATLKALSPRTSSPRPARIRPHDSKSCKYCQSKRPEPGQEGLAKLLDGGSCSSSRKALTRRTRAAQASAERRRDQVAAPRHRSETQPYITVGEPGDRRERRNVVTTKDQRRKHRFRHSSFVLCPVQRLNAENGRRRIKRAAMKRL